LEKTGKVTFGGSSGSAYGGQAAMASYYVKEVFMG